MLSPCGNKTSLTAYEKAGASDAKSTGTAAVTPQTAARWKIALPVAILIVAIGAGAYFLAHRNRVLTEKDTIVIADFSNSTGDPVFEGTLKQGLAVQLAQSPFLAILSDEKVHNTLKLMGRAPDERLTPEVARDLCQRTGSAAVIDGSIATLQDQLVLGLNAVECRNGEFLAGFVTGATR